MLYNITILIYFCDFEMTVGGTERSRAEIPKGIWKTRERNCWSPRSEGNNPISTHNPLSSLETFIISVFLSLPHFLQARGVFTEKPYRALFQPLSPTKARAFSIAHWKWDWKAWVLCIWATLLFVVEVWSTYVLPPDPPGIYWVYLVYRLSSFVFISMWLIVFFI